MNDHHVLRCRCGSIEGRVDVRREMARAVCYCKDCQAFARFLDQQGTALNAQGGTEIVATLPQGIRFTRGTEQIACMSLSGKGLLRWYAGCCRTPIGNTTRNSKMPYVGLIRACLPAPDAAFERTHGPLKIALNTESALGPVKATPVAALRGVLRIMKGTFGARLSGAWKDNPFFMPDSGQPLREPRVLTLEERKACEMAG